MKLLKNNWKWKLASLIIGIFMWSYITAGVNPTQSMTLSGVPLVIKNQDALTRKKYEITDMDIKSVSVKVTGKRNELGNLKKTDITAAIDAGSLKEGVQAASIIYTAPQHVVINETSESTIMLTVERIVTQNRPVSIKQTGELPAEFILNALTATPEIMEVTGPGSRLDRVKEIRAIVDVSNIIEDVSANKNVIAVDENGEEVSGVKLSLASVNVTCSVSKQKELPIELEFTGDVKENIKIKEIKLVPNTVLVKGKPALIDKLQAIKTKAIDRAKLISEGEFHLSLNYPEGIQAVKEGLDFKADLSLEKLETKKISIKDPSIDFDNLAEGFKALPAAHLEEINLEVRGFESDIKHINQDNIKFYVDLKNLTEGNSNLPLQMRPIEGISIIKIDPDSLTVNILKE